MNRQREQRGFTLIELMLAVALSSLLMIGVLAVITQLGAAAFKSNAESNTDTAVDALPDHVLDNATHLLRDDLDHATRVDASHNRLVIESYHALEARRRERMHRPVRITYHVQQIAGNPWLVRTQRALDVMTNQNYQRDLVCRGITRFELIPEPVTVPALVTSEVLKPASTSASEGQGPSAQDPDALNLKTTTDGERVSYLYKGMMYYRKHLPDHVQKRLPKPRSASNATDTSDRATTHQNAQTTSGNQNNEKTTGDSAEDEGLEATMPQTRWRLRVWAGDDTRNQPPDHDRVVTIR